MREKFVSFIKRETVLCAAFLLAVLSMLLVPPDGAYLSYIDFRTLSILFCLMAVMAGLRETGVFQCAAQALLGRVRRTRELVVVLVMLCFFSSMAVTNDVALITFVPFTFIVLDLVGPEARERLVVPVVVLQTVAANLGSMLTPVGNPQNLYLYGKAGMSLGAFLRLMLPHAALAFLALLLWSLRQSRAYAGAVAVSFGERAGLGGKGKILAVYTGLFLLALLTVARVVPYGAALAVTAAAVALTDRTILRQVDYSLLLTFVGFFIFVGNMGRLPVFSEFLRQVVAGHELLAGAAVSQIISNVPAALLLSGFTDDLAALAVGVDIGGLGTLIASMASLISYKLVAREESRKRGAYFRAFTGVNLCFLAMHLAFALLLRRW